MPRTKPTDYAKAAAALRDLHKLDNTARPQSKCPPGFIVPPYGDVVPRKKTSLAGLVALDREKRGRTVVTLPEISWGDVTDEDVDLPSDPVAQVRAETYLRAVIAYNARRRAA